MPRSKDDWLRTMIEGTQVLIDNVIEADRAADPPGLLAFAIRECRRLESDVFRYAEQLHGVTRERLEELLEQWGPIDESD